MGLLLFAQRVLSVLPVGHRGRMFGASRSGRPDSAAPSRVALYTMKRATLRAAMGRDSCAPNDLGENGLAQARISREM